MPEPYGEYVLGKFPVPEAIDNATYSAIYAHLTTVVAAMARDLPPTLALQEIETVLVSFQEFAEDLRLRVQRIQQREHR